MAFDTDAHPDDYWGSAMLLDRPKTSRPTQIGVASVGAPAPSGLRHPDDEWIPSQPGPRAKPHLSSPAQREDIAALEPYGFESATKRFNDLIDSIIAKFSSTVRTPPSTDTTETNHRADAESDAIDAWLCAAQQLSPVDPTSPQQGSGASGKLLADLFGDLLPETSSDPQADRILDQQGRFDLDSLEWRARARASEWVHDLPIYKASEIDTAVDRLARLLMTHESGAAHVRIRALITDGLTLAQIEDAAALKEFFEEEARLCLLRRFDRQQRTWTTSQGGSGLSWKLAARLLSVASLERLQEVLEVTWKDEWMHLPTRLAGWDTEVSDAFRSYLRYVTIRKHVRHVVKASRSQLRDQAGDSYDHPSDELAFRASAPSATTSDSAMQLTPTSLWVSNERPARPT